MFAYIKGNENFREEGSIMDIVEKQGSQTYKSKSSTQSKDQSSTKTKAIIALSSIPLIMTLGNSMLIPVLPLLEKKLSVSSFQASMIITVYSIVAIILIPIAGFLSDKIGRKKVITPSLILAGIGGLIAGLAAWKLDNSYWVILIGRALQGVGAAGASPIVLPLVGDLFKDEQESSSVLGMIETSNTFGKVLSPILGALLASFLWFLPFLAFPVFCVGSILLMIFLIKTPDKKGQQEEMTTKKFFQSIKETFRNNGRWLLAVFAIGCILMFVLFGVLFYLSEILEKKYDIDGVKKGFFLAIPLSALCISSFIAGKIIKENKPFMKWLTFCGIVLIAISMGIIILSTKLWYILLILSIAGIGIGVGLPCLDAMITNGIEKKERGTITSIYSSMRFIGVAAGPPILAVLMKQSNMWITVVLCGVSILAGITAFMAIKPEKEKQT